MLKGENLVLKRHGEVTLLYCTEAWAFSKCKYYANMVLKMH